jgi:hypothetical protein
MFVQMEIFPHLFTLFSVSLWIDIGGILASTCPMPQIISCVILAAKVKKPTPRAPK